MQTFFHVWKEGIKQDSTAWTAEMGIFLISNTSIFDTIICLKLALLQSFVSLRYLSAQGFWNIEFDELDFLSISNSNFAGYTGSKNLVQTRQKFQFIKLDFSNLIFQDPSADRYRVRGLKDISTLNFSTLSFKPGPFNPRLFNHEVFNPRHFNHEF